MKRILIVPVLLISFLMVSTKVSALAISSGVFQSNTCNTSSAPSDNCSINVNNSTTFSGYMIFSYNIVFNGPHYTLSQVYLDTATGPVACEIGSLSGFRDSGVQEYTDYGKCPISNGMTINKVVFRFANTASSIFYVNAGLYYTFVDDGNSDVISAIIAQTNSINSHIDTASSSIASAIASGVNSINDRQLTDKNDIVSQIQGQTNSINGRIDAFRSEIGSLFSNTTTAINNQTTTINNNINDIKDTDIDSDDKEEIDSTDYEDYTEAEEDLFDKLDNVDTDNLDFAIDVPTSNFVWDTITRFLNSNALIMNFLITILSIGVIKFALAR